MDKEGAKESMQKAMGHFGYALFHFKNASTKMGYTVPPTPRIMATPKRNALSGTFRVPTPFSHFSGPYLGRLMPGAPATGRAVLESPGSAITLYSKRVFKRFSRDLQGMS